MKDIDLKQIDAYVGGEMEGKEREGFIQRIKVNSQLRDQVKAYKELLEELEQEDTPNNDFDAASTKALYGVYETLEKEKLSGGGLSENPVNVPGEGGVEGERKIGVEAKEVRIESDLGPRSPRKNRVLRLRTISSIAASLLLVVSFYFIWKQNARIDPIASVDISFAEESFDKTYAIMEAIRKAGKAPGDSLNEEITFSKAFLDYKEKRLSEKTPLLMKEYIEFTKINDPENALIAQFFYAKYLNNLTLTTKQRKHSVEAILALNELLANKKDIYIKKYEIQWELSSSYCLVGESKNAKNILSKILNTDCKSDKCEAKKIKAKKRLEELNTH